MDVAMRLFLILWCLLREALVGLACQNAGVDCVLVVSCFLGMREGHPSTISRNPT